MNVDDVTSITVLGAGNMGHGIAEVAALAGYDVVLRDIKDEFVRKGYDQIEWSLNKLVERDRLSQDDADAALARVSTAVDLGEAVADADVVIEAVPEKMSIKKEVYTELEEHAPDHTVFATNTSSLSITELSEVTERPERFSSGMALFQPAGPHGPRRGHLRRAHRRRDARTRRGPRRVDGQDARPRPQGQPPASS